MTGWKASVVFHMVFWSSCFCTKDFFKEIHVPIYEEQDVTDVTNEPEYQSKVNIFCTTYRPLMNFTRETHSAVQCYFFSILCLGACHLQTSVSAWF